MLEDVHISKYASDELMTLGDRSVRVLKEITGETYLADVTGLIEKALSDVNRALGRDGSGDDTDRVKAQDKRRDRAYKNLRDYCQSCVTDFDPAIEKAGILLDGIFEKHGKSIWKLGLAKQTWAMVLLFADLEKPGAAEALKNAGAAGKYEQLKKEQAAFEDLYQEKVAGNSREKEIPLLADSVRALKRHFQHALTVVETLEELRPAKVEKAVAKLNAIIVDSRQIVLARIGREENEKKNSP